MVVPAEITAKHGVNQQEVFTKGGSSHGLEDAVFELATVANDHLLTARDTFKETGSKIPSEAMPVFSAAVSVIYRIIVIDCDENLSDTCGIDPEEVGSCEFQRL